MKGLDGRSKYQIDARFVTYLVVIVLISFGLIVSGIIKLKSSSEVECKDLKRINIPKGDKDYYPSLDGDHDNIACEK